MNRSLMLKKLLDHNPFSASVAGEPWEGRYPDVWQINDHVHVPLLQLVQILSRDPHTPLAALVLGEAGSGKTHLLRRLADGADLSNRGSPAANLAFVYVHPLLDPQRPLRHLLREVVISLGHRVRPGHALSQLHLLLLPLLLESWGKMVAGKKVRAKEESALKQATRDGQWFFQSWLPDQKKKWRLALTSQLALLLAPLGRVDQQTLKVLLHLGDSVRGPLAMAWLRGDILDHDHAKALGVSDRQQQREEAMEEEARTLLATLATILVYGQTPLLVCFDRLENLRSEAHYRAFESLIDYLVGEMPATLPIALVRGEQWGSQLAKQLNPHVVQRLAGNTFELRGCVPAMASLLVESRLSYALGESWQREEPSCQTLLDELTPSFTGRQFSREILATANKKVLALLEQPMPTPRNSQQVLGQAWQEWLDKIIADLDNHPPDGERLAHALALLMPPAGPSLLLPSRAVVMESPNGFLLVDSNRHHLAVLGTLNHATNLLRQQPDRVILCVRDGRSPIPPPPKWPGTNQVLQRFMDLGGHYWELQPQEVAAFYALSHLHQLVVGGDINQLSEESQWLTVTENGFNEFVRELPESGISLVHLFNHLQERLAVKPSPAKPAPPPPCPTIHTRQLANLVESLTHVLESLPAHMGMASHLAELLRQRGVHTTLQLLLHGVEKHQDRFALFPSANGTIIQLRGKWRHEQARR